MSFSQTLSQGKLKLLERFLPDANAATLETAEILMDLDQISTLLGSFDDIRRGHVVSMLDAFAEL